MLEKTWLQILSMSYTASYVILLVLLVRTLLRKAPKRFAFMLWSVVFFRLLCPLSIESPLSIIPEPMVVQATQIESQSVITSPPPSSTELEKSPAQATRPMERHTDNYLDTLWGIGVLCMMLYSIGSYLRLKRRLRHAKKDTFGIYRVNGLETPFVMGIFKPKIYLPSHLSPEDMPHILLHEQMHISRHDPISKCLAYFALCLHWFNPLVWLSFYLFSKDMEMSCDEAVIKKMGANHKVTYSESLLSLTTGAMRFPLAFGNGDTKARVKNILGFKQTKHGWIVFITLVVGLIGAALLTNPANKTVLTIESQTLDTKTLEEALYTNISSGISTVTLSKGDNIGLIRALSKTQVTTHESSPSRAIDRPKDYVLHFALPTENPLEFQDLFLNFNEDLTEIWINNDIKPTLSYAVSSTEALQETLEKLIENDPQASWIQSLFQAKTPYMGDNTAVSHLLNLMPLPSGYNHMLFKMYTQDANRKIEWQLSKKKNVTFSTADFENIARLLFTLIDNVEEIEFVVPESSNKAYFSRKWADDWARQDIRNYGQSIAALGALIQTQSPNTPMNHYVTSPFNKEAPEKIDFKVDGANRFEPLYFSTMARSFAYKAMPIDQLSKSHIVRFYYPENQEAHTYYLYDTDAGVVVLQESGQDFAMPVDTLLYQNFMQQKP